LTSELEPASPTAAPTRPDRLGRLPELAALAGLGIVLIAIGNTLARSEVNGAEPVFWGGIAVIVGPIGWRLLGMNASASERLGLVVLMGMALYVAKVLNGPLGFSLFDEILHVRTADDILSSGRLFERNPLLLVSPPYPGLEIVTDLIRRATGSSAFEVGVVVAGAARLLLVVGVFLFCEFAARSARIAGIATFVYMANPNFVFFDAQFAYETLALGLTAIALYLTAISGGSWRRGALAAIMTAAAVIATHHITTYNLIGFLVIWTITWRLFGRTADRGPGPGRIALAAVVSCVLWIFLVATEIIQYLGPRVVDAYELLLLVTGQAESRELFVSTAGQLAPAWERAVGFLAVIFLLLAQPFGIWRIWRGFRDQPAAVALGLVAMAYPASLALRLTQRGAEVSTRTPEFLFLGLGFVVAMAVTMTWRISPLLGRWVWRLAAPAATLVFLGGMVIGVPPWARLPGPYIPSADVRSIEREGVSAAEWAATELGPGNRIVADRTNRILMGSYGRQNPITQYGDGIRSWSVFFSSEYGPEDQAILETGRIDYLVIDLRLANARPLTRVYFERGEPPLAAREGRLQAASLTKFEAVPGVSIVFDSGNIRIYDVRALSAGPALR
jgi:hypothetical protein